jgi:hypothetical protein
MSVYASMNLPELLSHRDQISAEIFRQTGDATVIPIASANSAGGKVKLTKTGKVRKPSSNKGKPTARGDFTKKITAEHADDFAAYKEANPDLKGPHLSWYKHYIDEHKEEYDAFKAAWALEHPKESSDGAEGESSDAAAADGAEAAAVKPKKVLSPEHLAKMKAGREAKLAEKKAAKDLLEAAAIANGPVSPPPVAELLAAEAAAEAATKLKQPKKVTKKVTVTAPAPVPVAAPEPVAAPAEAEVDAAPEQLPFKHKGVTYIRIGIQKADGNHEWVSTDLWHSKKGARAGYAGELMGDGSINEDAEEPELN